MPALLPVCANLYEVGAFTKDGDNMRNLLVDSPDGLIKIDHNRRDPDNCCEVEVFGFNDDDISVEVKNPYPDPEKLPVHYKLPKWYILQVLIHMAATGCVLNWYAAGEPKSVVLIKCNFDDKLWEQIWARMKTFLDHDKPAATHWMKKIAIEFRDQFDDYTQQNTELLGEIPRVTTEENKSAFLHPFKFSPYNKALEPKNRHGPELDDVKQMMHTTYLKALWLLHDAYHIVREEAAEIIAFVLSDSTRIPQPRIPRHIPIAYGLKGHSLPMDIMRGMVNDVRYECASHHINVRCEIYNGQFLNLVRFTDDGTPLTRLAFFQQYFKEIQKWSKVYCINYLVTEAIPNGVPLDLITTPDKVHLWQRNWDEVTRHRERLGPWPDPPGLDAQDITHLLWGSQLGSRLQRQVHIDTDDEEEDADNDDDADAEDNSTEDPDYIANDSDYDINYDSDYSDASSDLEDELADLITDQRQDEPTELTFLQDLLQSLRELKQGQIKWQEMDVDDLVNTYLKNPPRVYEDGHWRT